MSLNLIKSTLLSLKVHKLRVFLTMIGIIIGIASVVSISTLGAGMKKQVMSTASFAKNDILKLEYSMSGDENENVIYYDQPQDFSFSRSDMKRLRDIDGVQTLFANYGSNYMGDNIDVQFDYFGSSTGMMISPNKGQHKIQYGRDFTEDDRNKDVILLSGDILTMDLSKEDPEKMIGRAVKINGYMFKVIGIMEPFSYENLSATEAMSVDWTTAYSNFVSKASYNELASTKQINGISIKLDKGADKAQVLDTAITNLTSNHPDLQGVFQENNTEEEQQKQMESSINGITYFLMAITAISLLVGGIGVMNITYVSVTERKREIGIRRAIGAKPKDILLQFVMESAAITLIGGIIGVAVGFGLSQLVGGFIDIVPVMTPQIFVLSTSISIITGVVFGILPAISASKMQPIEAIYK